MSELYANAESAVARVRKSLVWNLGQIRTANGYLNDIGDIFTEIPGETEIRNFPAIALLRGQTIIENEDQSEQLWHKLTPYTALVYVRSQNPTEARESILQDLERMLGVNWMLTGEDGVETCRIASLDGDRPFGMVINKPQVGFTFGFSVRFAQDINDPSVAG